MNQIFEIQSTSLVYCIIFFIFILIINFLAPKFILVGFLLDFLNITKKICLFTEDEGGGSQNLIAVQSIRIKPNIKGVMIPTVHVISLLLNEDP